MGPDTKAKHPSNVQTWSSHAMFSGAIRSAPRWSATGLTGKPTACSRGISSRPPPEAAAETMAMRSTPTSAVGSSDWTSVRRSPSGR